MSNAILAPAVAGLILAERCRCARGAAICRCAAFFTTAVATRPAQGVERETRSDRRVRTGDWLSRQLARRPSTSWNTPLCNIQSICRSIHSGPPFLKCLCRTPLWGALMPFGSGGRQSCPSPRRGRAVSIPSRSTPVLGITRSGVAFAERGASRVAIDRGWPAMWRPSYTG